MTLLTDLVYLVVALVTSPVWLVRMIRTGKIRTDWSARFGCTEPLGEPGGRRVLIHEAECFATIDRQNPSDCHHPAQG